MDSRDEDVSGESTRRRYSAEFRAEAVRLVASGERSQAEVARNLGIGSATINKWCREADGSVARPPDSAEVAKLKTEVRRLKLEHEILKKAAAFFAKNQM